MGHKFPLFDKDVDIIQKLGDTPGIDNNLDWKQLQAKFDEGANLLKEHINKIVTELNTVLGSDGAFISGGNLLGNINANMNRIFGLQEPAQGNEAATKNYVDVALKALKDVVSEKLNKDGGALNGPLDMRYNKIANLAVPSSQYDAANKKYVDERTVFFENVIVPSGSWTNGGMYAGAGFPFTANVILQGVDASMVAIVAFSENDKKDITFCGSCNTGAGLIQVYAETNPGRDITLAMITLLKR